MKLELIDLCKNYEGKIALDHMNLVLEPGIYGILGANGAGKSTLMNMITDNIKRSSGSITYDGEEILHMGSRFRKKVGYMPQEQGFYEQFSPNSFLLYMALLKGIPRKEAKKQINELLEIVNLKHVAKKKISSFSGGMKQRVLLAQALLGDPDIIILDEPTAGLDPKERIHIRNFIMELSKNKIILFATHVVSDIECIADQVLLLRDGKLIKIASPIELIQGVENHIFEIECVKDNILELKRKFKSGNLIQKKYGLVFRVAACEAPEGFHLVGDDVNLEDVYLYYLDDILP